MSLVSNVPVQVEFHKDCELWAYPGSGEKVLLHDARSVHVEMELFGNAGGRLTFVLDATSPHFDAVIQDSRVYILFRRCGRDEGSFIIANCGRHRTNDGVIEEGAVEFMCLPVVTELDGIRILPDLAASETSYRYAGYPDDGMKDCLRKQIIAATSYNDPGGNARELEGWQVAVNKSQHGTSNADMEARGEKLLDKVSFWSGAHDFIDFDAYIVWSGGNLKVEFDTYYPRRGADRSRINTDGNDYVFLNDAGDNILNVQLHKDMTEERNAIYDEALSAVARDTGRRTSYGLREKIVKVHFHNELTAALQKALDEYTVADGVEYTLTQTARFKYGEHFELGDRISHNNIYFGTAIKHEVVKHVTLDYGEDGFETLQLTMGNPEPDLIDRIKGGMGRENFDFIIWGDDVQPVGSANAPTVDAAHPNILFPRDDHIHRFGIADDSVAVVDPDANGIINVIGDGTVTTTKTAANTLTLSAVSSHDAVTLHATLAANLLGLSTQQLTLDDQAANLIFAGPTSGVAAAPAFRALVDDDVPNTITLDNISQITTRPHSSLTGIGANDHHNQSHVLATNLALGPDHTVSGATAGHVLRASGATTALFAQLQHGDLGGVTSDQHHAQVHVVNSAGPHAESGLTIGHVLRASGAAAFSFAALIAADIPQLDHGGLAGLGDHDHAIYARIATNETISGTWIFSNELTINKWLNVTNHISGQCYRIGGTQIVSSGRSIENIVNISLSGNITVGGTVDGVDISALKSAYDVHVHNVTGGTGSWTTGAYINKTQLLNNAGTPVDVYVRNYHHTHSVGTLATAAP